MQTTLEAPTGTTVDITDFDLDVQIELVEANVQPQITSVIFCTPGCGNTGSFNSFCC